MDKSLLERYFDEFIADDPLKGEEEEEVKEEQTEDELFFSLLPDELLLYYKGDTDNSKSLDYSSQNSRAAAKLLGRLSAPTLGASLVHPTAPKMPKTQRREIIPQIQNVFSSVRLGCCLDLDFIANRAWNTEYNPEKCKALFMRIREPRTTAKIHKSGAVVCVGAKSVQESRLAARRFARKIQKLGFPVCCLNFKIHNIMATCSTFPISIERMAHHQDCSYEPELFPGLIYKGIPGITMTIFSSGNLCFTGAKSEADIYKAIDTIYPFLSCFRR